VNASSVRYPGLDRVEAYYESVDRALRAVPGTRHVATASEMPFTGNAWHDVFIIKERGDLGHDNPQVRVANVGPGFWESLGIPVVAGRTFSSADARAAPRVAIVNDVLAKRFYPGQNPVGHVINWNRDDWEIIGVVGSTRLVSMLEQPEPEMFTSDLQVTPRSRYVILQSTMPVDQLIPRVRTALRDIDPTIAITELATMDERMADAVAPQRFRAALVAGLGTLAVVLSMLGVYGVVAYAVSRRTREIGIRMALGEARGKIRRRVVGSALRIAAAGAAVGVVLATAVSRWLSSFLVGVSPRDPLTLVAATAVLLGVATAAAYIPARRASRVDPVVALRSD
jgi:putative ABC transport system permease protein